MSHNLNLRGIFKQMRGQSPEPVSPSVNEMTRTYLILNGPPNNRVWSARIEARDAVAVVREAWKASPNWTELDYETVYCVATKEVVYVKCTYFPKIRSARFEMMWGKPKRVARVTDPKKKQVRPKPLPTSVPSAGAPVNQ